MEETHPQSYQCYRCRNWFPRSLVSEEPCCGAPDCDSVIFICEPCEDRAYGSMDKG